jgi:hypothetical protein
MKKFLAFLVTFHFISNLFPLPVFTQVQSSMNSSYEVYTVKAITNDRILPSTYPINGSQDGLISFKACRGEYESASFAVYTPQQLQQLQVTVGDLMSTTQQVIPASAVDIRVVKCWFQSGTISIFETDKCVLVPELLLKDDKLLKVDVAGEKQYLRTIDSSGVARYDQINVTTTQETAWLAQNSRPQDAKNLQPVDIDAGMGKQFWVTVHVPENAAPGQYAGKITLTPANAPATELTLNLQVLPFVLEKPKLRYSMFYRGCYSPTLNGSTPSSTPIDTNYKSPQQYLAEMQDLKAHGIDYPTTYERNMPYLQQQLSIRTQVGLPAGILYHVGITDQDYRTSTGWNIAGWQQTISNCQNNIKAFGYNELYVYGIDNTNDTMLASERPIWDAARQLGAKIFVACYASAFSINPPDLPIVSCWPNNMNYGNLEMTANFHSIGLPVFGRSSPPSGTIEPETHRRSYGLYQWKQNYNGAMNYAYQASYGSFCWNNFQAPGSRNNMYTYPTIDGVVSTLGWEAFREGVDDVRYLTTLLKAIQNADSTKADIAAQAQAWIAALNPAGDLEALRAQMIDWILQLQPAQQTSQSTSTGTSSPGTTSTTGAYAISPTTKSFSAIGGSGTIKVTGTSVSPWTASSSVPWITIDSPLSPVIGNGQARYNVRANPTGVNRQGAITIAGQQVVVNQRRK